jgi:hypothetical protein
VQTQVQPAQQPQQAQQQQAQLYTPMPPALAQRQAAAVARLRGQPPLILVYGDSKMGKSVDALFAMPQALFIGPRGAFKPAVPVVGWAPLEVCDVTELDEIFALIQKKLVPNSPFKGLVIDDVSSAAKANKLKHERSGKDGWSLWGAVGHSLARIIGYCRDTVGVPVFLISHARAPDYNKAGQLVCKGCPDMPTESLSLEFPRHCDVAARADNDPSRSFGRPWSGVYRAGLWSGAEWVTGDRNHVIRDKAPMNMAEIIRAAGTPMLRAPGMEWLEPYVEGSAQEILGGAMDRTIIGGWVQRFRANSVPEWMIGWYIRDTTDRVEIRRHAYSPVSAYGY